MALERASIRSDQVRRERPFSPVARRWREAPDAGALEAAAFRSPRPAFAIAHVGPLPRWGEGNIYDSLHPDEIGHVPFRP